MNIPDSFKLEIGDNLTRALGHAFIVTGIVTGASILGAIVVSVAYIAT